MVDRYGLLTDGMTELQKFQEPLVQKESAIASWDKSKKLGLAQVVKQAKITVLFRSLRKSTLNIYDARRENDEHHAK